MKIQAVIIMLFVTITCSSRHLPSRHVLGPVPESITKNGSTTTPDCVPVAYQDTHSILRTRMKRSQIRKISVSPEPPPPPYIKPDNSTKADNSTNTNGTLLIQQPSRKLSSWIPTLEDIVTPIFRAVILVLTLFNVNITWRIHALHVGRRPLRQHLQPAGRGWPV